MVESVPSRPAVALLGTGIIGAAVARNLARAGFPVSAWNRTRAKAEPLAADGVRIAGTPGQAVAGASIVLTVLKDGPAVLDVVKEAAPHMAEGTVWVQLSTVGDIVGELAAFAAEHGLGFVDAPVQGTRQPAERGELIVLAAGDLSAREVVQPLFDTIGKRTLWVSQDSRTGAASRLKLVLNTWVITLTHGVGEALALARGLQVDPELFMDAVAGGPMDSGYFRAKSAAILSADYTTSFSVDNAEKDATLVLEAARHVGIRMDVVEAGRARFARASQLGHGAEDMAAGYFASFR